MVPVQVPVDEVRVCPGFAVPDAIGGDVFAGAMAATGADCADWAVALPAVFVAVTSTRMVDPTSTEPAV